MDSIIRGPSYSRDRRFPWPRVAPLPARTAILFVAETRTPPRDDLYRIGVVMGKTGTHAVARVREIELWETSDVVTDTGSFAM